jgi:hypothetical protein
LKVAVFTSIRHRHHYVNIHLQNIIAIQDPLIESFSMPLISQDKTLKSIENEISAYEDSSNINNETFRIFSQSDHEDDDQPPLKKPNSAFNRIQSKINSSSANKFKSTIHTITPPSSIAENDLEKQIEADLNSEGNLFILIISRFFFFWFY